MAYCAIGSISNADWIEIKRLCKQLRDEINEKFRNLDTDAIQVLRNKLSSFELSLDALRLEQTTQNTRLDNLENSSANTELTVSEVLDMYTGAGNV